MIQAQAVTVTAMERDMWLDSRHSLMVEYLGCKVKKQNKTQNSLA